MERDKLITICIFVVIMLIIFTPFIYRTVKSILYWTLPKKGWAREEREIKRHHLLATKEVGEILGDDLEKFRPKGAERITFFNFQFITDWGFGYAMDRFGRYFADEEDIVVRYSKPSDKTAISEGMFTEEFIKELRKNNTDPIVCFQIFSRSEQEKAKNE